MKHALVLLCFFLAALPASTRPARRPAHHQVSNHQTGRPVPAQVKMTLAGPKAAFYAFRAGWTPLSSDKPVHQSGQMIYLRAVALDTVTGCRWRASR